MLSEFSYGYALTEQLTRSGSGTLIAAPVFPSLFAEGQPDAGYDVQIPFPVAPLFLQFKLSHRMQGGNAAEYNLFNGPYYRMQIRPSRFSNQHAALLNLEQRGENVFYAAPCFHTMPELTVAYLARMVVQRSAFFPPSIIGPLPDQYDHYVAFSGTAAYFCSEPRKLSYNFSGRFHAERFRALAQRAEFHADKRFFLDLLDKMATTLAEEGKFPEHLAQLHDADFRETVSRSEVARLAAFTARSGFDSELLLLGYKPDQTPRKRGR
jgi:hypothetical protein